MSSKSARSRRQRTQFHKAVAPQFLANLPGTGTIQARPFTDSDVMQQTRLGAYMSQPMPRDPRDMVPFGPLHPLRPQQLDPSRPDTHRAEPRISEYEVAVNLPGVRDNHYIDWKILRMAAESVDIMRRCIELRKDHLAPLKWAWTVSPEAVSAAYQANPAAGKTDLERELREQFLPQINRMTEFWAKPWKTHGINFAQWVRGMMEEHLVLDAVVIYPEVTYGGDVLALNLIDGGTIKPLRDYRGQRPQGDFPAFQQMLYGFPRGEWQATAEAGDEPGKLILPNTYVADQLFYYRKNFRLRSMYGYSPTEQALIAARLYMKRKGWMLSEYDDGVVPQLIVKATETQAFTPRERVEYEQTLNDDLTGQTHARHRAKFLPPGMDPVLLPSVDERYKPDYDLFLIKMIASFYGVSMTSLGFTESKGLGSSGMHQAQADAQEIASINPDQVMISDLINDLSHDYLGVPKELIFAWVEDEGDETLQGEQANQILLTTGQATINDGRRRQGLPLFTEPEADMPFILGGQGPVFLSGTFAAQQASQAAAAAGAQQAQQQSQQPPAGDNPQGKSQAVDKSYKGPDPDKAQAVYDQLLADYPASAVEWVHGVHWSGPKPVKMKDIDFDDEGSWAAEHEPGRVGRFARRIAAGKQVNPVVLVQEPGFDTYRVVDGHHRTLGARQAGQDVMAYIGKVGNKLGPWTTMHSDQYRSGDADSTKEYDPSLAPTSGAAYGAARGTDAEKALGDAACTCCGGSGEHAGGAECSCCDGTGRADAQKESRGPCRCMAAPDAAKALEAAAFRRYVKHGKDPAKFEWRYQDSIDKVGPKGYEHGWIFVGAPGVGDAVTHAVHGAGKVSRVEGGRVHVDFANGRSHSFEVSHHADAAHFEPREDELTTARREESEARQASDALDARIRARGDDSGSHGAELDAAYQRLQAAKARRVAAEQAVSKPARDPLAEAKAAEATARRESDALDARIRAAGERSDMHAAELEAAYQKLQAAKRARMALEKSVGGGDPDDPKGRAPGLPAQPPDSRWPAWLVDTALATLTAAKIRKALTRGLPIRALLAAFEQWAGHLRGTGVTPNVGVWLAQRGTEKAIETALTQALGDGTAQAAAAGIRSAVALLDVSPVDWKGWKPGNIKAARLILSEDGTEVGLQRLLDDAGVQISSIAANRLDEVAAVLADGLERGLSPREIGVALEGVLDDPEWALTVAWTETNRAQSAAALDTYRARGTDGKSWFTAHDQRVCPRCAANADEGVIPIDQPFVSGEMHPPGHPRCRCAPAPGRLPLVKAAGETIAERGHEYWTVGRGLAKWVDTPHPWTALRDHLVKFMDLDEANRTATQWFHEVTGTYPNSGHREKSISIDKVGPKGYIHGWIFVGVPGVGEEVRHPKHGKGIVTGHAGGIMTATFKTGDHSFETAPKARPPRGLRPRHHEKVMHVSQIKLGDMVKGPKGRYVKAEMISRGGHLTHDQTGIMFTKPNGFKDTLRVEGHVKVRTDRPEFEHVRGEAARDMNRWARGARKPGREQIHGPSERERMLIEADKDLQHTKAELAKAKRRASADAKRQGLTGDDRARFIKRATNWETMRHEDAQQRPDYIRGLPNDQPYSVIGLDDPTVAGSRAIQPIDHRNPLSVYGNMLTIHDRDVRTHAHLSALENDVPAETHAFVARSLAEQKDHRAGLFVGSSPAPDLDDLKYLRGLSMRTDNGETRRSWDEVGGVRSGHTIAVGYAGDWGMDTVHQHSTAVHELGHGLDQALGADGSKSQKWEEIHAKALADARTSPRFNPYYERPEEMFAEGFSQHARGMSLGGSTAARKRLAEHFGLSDITALDMADYFAAMSRRLKEMPHGN